MGLAYAPTSNKSTRAKIFIPMAIAEALFGFICLVVSIMIKIRANSKKWADYVFDLAIVLDVFCVLFHAAELVPLHFLPLTYVADVVVTYICIHIYICMYTYIFIHIHAYIYMYTYVYVYIYIYACICILIYTYICNYNICNIYQRQKMKWYKFCYLKKDGQIKHIICPFFAICPYLNRDGNN